MSQIAIIGAGISGLTTAHLLKDKGHTVTVFEKESTPGGLIRCKRVDGSLFHICGGHVFNTKRENVLDFFWRFFNKDAEFIKADRNSVVFMDDDLRVPYPIENHMYLFDDVTQKLFIDDLLNIAKSDISELKNFEEFLRRRFGETLYNAYFRPYNEKVWRRELSQVPLSWLEGKLPMPTVQEMIFNNMNHVEEKQFVHSTFYYEKQGGSQFIADRLAENLNIKYNQGIREIKVENNVITVNGDQFEKLVFCGNIKDLPHILKGVDLALYAENIEKLEYHGTTAVFCEIERNPYSWIYLPSDKYESHRIICTGNFSESNNRLGKMTATVEFTDEISEEEIEDNLRKMPLNPRYLTHCYNKYTYPIQDQNTRDMVKNLKDYLSKKSIYFTGRFADWEYYNMDVAIDAAMNIAKNL